MAGFQARDANNNIIDIIAKNVTALSDTGLAQGFILIDQAGTSFTFDVNGGLPVQATKPDSGTPTSVAAATTSTSLIGLNANRLGVCIFNDSTDYLYVALGFVASTTSFTIKLPGSGFYETPFAGAINGVWASATGSARITELTT